MEKSFIKNRKGLKVAVIVEQPPNPQGLDFVMHGLGGYKEQPHVQIFAGAFLHNNYTTVLFDTTNTFGESDGNYEDATTTNYYEDLEDVIKWAATQPWYREPFCLVGHSLGGIAVALFAEKYPAKVKALAPISTVVSGKMSEGTHAYKADLDDWRKTGWLIKPSYSKPGTVKKLKWSHMEDRLKYNLLPNVNKLTMPVLMMVGENDDSTPPEHQKVLFDALPGKKELHIIPSAPHTFRDPEHLGQIGEIMDRWIKSL